MIIKFHFMQYSRLEHDDLISRNCFVTLMILSDYERLLRVTKFCWENNYLPSMIFLLQKSLLKIVL